MLKRDKINTLEDFFIPYYNRTNKGYYFCRITAYSEQIETFLCKYMMELRKCGVFVKGKILNPDDRQLSFFHEVMGEEFRTDPGFLQEALKKWLPRLKEKNQKDIACSLYDVLNGLAQQGKTKNMLRNAYIKFMCWMYYKFEPVLLQLERDILPKILYEGTISEYELKMLHILATAGCDVLILEYDKDYNYLKIDAASAYSELYIQSGKEFPSGFSVEIIQQKMIEKQNEPELPLQEVKKKINTNTWLTGNIMYDSIKPQSERGGNGAFYYNIFAGIFGVEEKSTYYNDLIKWKMKLESLGRKVFIIENGITMPDYTEVSKIKRNDYKNNKQLIADMLSQIVISNLEIKKYVRNAMIEMFQGDDQTDMRKLTNRLVCLICWVNKFIPKLFKDGMIMNTSTLIYYGNSPNVFEVHFLKILSELPIDVVLIHPDLSVEIRIQDKLFFEKKYTESLPKENFPTQIDSVKFGTDAYHAEQDLNTLLYQGTGMYRNQQFKKAISISLQTTNEEIEILWDQEATFRPNFETLDDRVMVPVIFSKVSGVSGDLDDYWYRIAKLQTEYTYTIYELPFIKSDVSNLFKDKAYNFFKNGKINVQKIKENPKFPYSFIRNEMQDYMLYKLQQLIDKKTIVGTGTKGTEYIIIATVLNLDKQLLKMIQKYDFTKAIPKLLIISTNENECSIEDSILVAYLNLVGFDITIFVPTGYRSIERYFVNSALVEHQVGEYMYDLTIPNLKNIKQKREGIASKIFRRGR